MYKKVFQDGLSRKFSTVEAVLYDTCHIWQTALYGIIINSHYSVLIYLRHVPPNVCFYTYLLTIYGIYTYLTVGVKGLI